MRVILSPLLSLALLLSTPGLSEAAAIVRPVAAGAWGRAAGQALHRSLAAPASGLSPRLERALGHARLAATLSPGSAETAAALSFVAHLPAGPAADPAGFAALEPAAQAAALEPALAAASAELRPQAQAFLARVRGRALSAAEERELSRLAAAWFYLDAATGAELRRLAAERREARAAGLGRSIAGRLLGKRAEPDQLAAAAEVSFALEGVARLAGERAPLARGEDADAFVRDVLSPYAERALDRADSLRVQRGDEAPVYGRVLSGHRLAFGGAAAKPALRALRRAGAWTPLVSAVSLHAARRLEEGGEEGALRSAAADSDLSLPIPAWRPEAGAAPSVAALLESRHGAKPPSVPFKVRLFTLLGIPVGAQLGFFVALPLMTYQVATMFFPGAPNPFMLGLAAVGLLYVTLLGHEFGHALAARAFGLRTHAIALTLLGGGAYIEREPRRPIAEIAIAAAGPAVNLLAAAALYPLALSLDPGVLRALVSFSIFANVFIGALNLVPAYPMDGGRILRGALAWVLRDHYKATHVAARIGIWAGMALSLYGWWVFATRGDWTALILVVMGFFMSSAARAATFHPGTELVEPARAPKAPNTGENPS